MEFEYEDYADTDGIFRFAEITKNFNFGPHLAAASFPDSFITAYVGQFDDEGATRMSFSSLNILMVSRSSCWKGSTARIIFTAITGF